MHFQCMDEGFLKWFDRSKMKRKKKVTSILNSTHFFPRGSNNSKHINNTRFTERKKKSSILTVVHISIQHAICFQSIQTLYYSATSVFFFSSFLSALLFVIHSVKNLHSTLRLSLSRSMLLFAMRINKISFERISSSAVQRKPIQHDRYNSMQVNGKIFFSNPNKKKLSI